MSKPKFRHGETVTHGEKKVTIKVAKKNFRTGAISYLTTEGDEVNEKDLKGKPVKKVKDLNTDPALVKLQDRYEKLYGQPAAPAWRNKTDWLTKKIEEKEVEIAAVGGDVDGDTDFDGKSNEEKLEALASLDRDGLIALIDAKELEIDESDYESDEELLQAVCDELDVELPSDEE